LLSYSLRKHYNNKTFQGVKMNDIETLKLAPLAVWDIISHPGFQLGAGSMAIIILAAKADSIGDSLRRASRSLCGRLGKGSSESPSFGKRSSAALKAFINPPSP
jgi:hypothetical protein